MFFGTRFFGVDVRWNDLDAVVPAVYLWREPQDVRRSLRVAID